MGLRRDEWKKDWPPPPYYPGCISINVVLHCGGECIEGPLAAYRGGYEVIYDHVNTKGIDFWTLLYYLRDEEVCGDKVQYFILEDGAFKLISDDQHLKDIAGKWIKERVLHIYVVNCGSSDSGTESECGSDEVSGSVSDIDCNIGEVEAARKDDSSEKVVCEGGAQAKDNGEFEVGAEIGLDVDDRADVEEVFAVDLNAGSDEDAENEGPTGDQDGGLNNEWQTGLTEFEDEDLLEFGGDEESDEEDAAAINQPYEGDFVESDYEVGEEVEEDGAGGEVQQENFDCPGGQGNNLDELSEGDKSDNDMVTVGEDFDERLVEDEENDGSRKAPVFNSSEIYKPVITLEMLFATRDEFKKAVKSLAVMERRQVKFTRTTPRRVYAKCDAPNCKWRICAHKVRNEDSLQVTRFDSKHTCTESHDVPAMNSRWLSERFLHKFISDPKRSAEGFRLDVVKKLKINVTRHQAIAAKKMALIALHGSSEYQFSRLWDYVDELRTRNPGSTVVLGTKTVDGEIKFDRFYACFHALKKGWREGCRPLIGVDGCHLSGPHKGILLTAVGVDPNNALYPIAYAIVPIENTDNWEWFLSMLKTDLQLGSVPNLTFISDRQKGLIHAMSELFPGTDHRFCVRHMHKNFCTAGYRGQALKNLLWSAARSGTVPEFMHRMKKIREYSEGAWKWLNERPATQWSKSHFSEGPMCDMLLNNLCESFNSCIKPARDKTIITSLEWIREYIMKRHAENLDKASIKWCNKLICPMIEKILQKNMSKIGDCIPIKSSDRHYQIRMMEGDGQYVVDLGKRECSCRLWQLSGYPCLHGLAAITKQRYDPSHYVDHCFSVATYKKAYQYPIVGISSDMFWQAAPYIPPCPPNYMRGVGRPPKSRRLDVEETKKKTRARRRYTTDPSKMTRRQITAHCSVCKKPGHRVTTCPEVPEEIREERRQAKARKRMLKNGAGTSDAAAGISSSNDPNGNVVAGATPNLPLIRPPTSPPQGSPNEEHNEEHVITQDHMVWPPPLVPGPSINEQMLGLGPSTSKKSIPYKGGSWRAPQFSTRKKGPPVHNLESSGAAGRKGK